MDLTPYVENVRRHTAELKRRNAEATARARRDLPRLVEVLRAFGGVEKAYLYGSLAKGTFHPGGDIDIAVEGASTAEMDELRARLEEAVGFGIDLRDLDGTPEFRRVVEAYGELLHGDT
ncbi:MAG: nucleotidyltransferase domain-containing protein [Phycisphaerae bacterium]